MDLAWNLSCLRQLSVSRSAYYCGLGKGSKKIPRTGAVRIEALKPEEEGESEHGDKE